MLKLMVMRKSIVPASLAFFTSFLFAQTPEQIEFALKVVPAAVDQLRELSPTYRKTAEAR